MFCRDLPCLLQESGIGVGTGIPQLFYIWWHLGTEPSGQSSACDGEKWQQEKLEKLSEKPQQLEQLAEGFEQLTEQLEQLLKQTEQLPGSS